MSFEILPFKHLSMQQQYGHFVQHFESPVDVFTAASVQHTYVK